LDALEATTFSLCTDKIDYTLFIAAMCALKKGRAFSPAFALLGINRMCQVCSQVRFTIQSWCRRLNNHC
jgi:hypothetical protein